MTLVPLLAHAGEGHTWQALLVVAALGLVVVVATAVAGRLTVDSVDDLVLPIASILIVSALAPLGSEVLSDWVGWAFPPGVVALVALLVAATTPLELRVTSPLFVGTAVLAVVGALVLHGPITRAWHPPEEFLPEAGDLEVEIVSPVDGDPLTAGPVEVTVRVVGGSIGPEGFTVTEQLPADPAEAGTLLAQLDGQPVEVAFDTPCTLAAPCDEVTFAVEVPPGLHDLRVEFTRGDGVPFSPLVLDRVTLEAADPSAAGDAAVRQVSAQEEAELAAARDELTAAGMACPVDEPRSFGDVWGAPRSAGGSHRGIDLLTPDPAPVRAITAGTYEVRTPSAAAGRWAVLHGDDGAVYWYLHLAEHRVEDGARVAGGDEVAVTGDTGVIRGQPLVHVELRPGGGRAVDPFPLLRVLC
ncbi:M23 family metallopeptidase [Nitriliruptoraceae bacterium ZYF776]|nr:M23 family metallopeptidase [Profundirhabdus halotolerans]